MLFFNPKQRFILLILLLNIVVSSSVAFCQPSFHVNFQFRLFNQNGESVDYNKFCSDYVLLGENHRNDLTPCRNSSRSKSSFYVDSSKEFNGGGTIIYNDLVREFIHEKDTMTIVFATNGAQSRSFQIDSLVFKSGKYLIKEKHLQKVDFNLAEVDYYNMVLKNALNIKNDFADYKKFVVWAELNFLRKKYRIAEKDFEKKTVAQIFK